MYTVYRHVSPSGKSYVGITSKYPPSLRWGNRGEHYSENDYFTKAIHKYGWDNFIHEILADNLTEDDAKALEVKYISEFKSNDSNFGYNLTSGGEHNYPNQVIRDKLSNHMHNIMHKLKSEEAMKKFKETRRRKYESGYSPVWVNDGYHEITVDRRNLEIYLESGYVLGRLTSSVIYMSKGDLERRINSDDKEKYLAEGWKLGRCDRNKLSFKLSNQQFSYSYCGLQFSSTYELKIYLNSNGYPTISESSIQNIVNGKVVKKYSSLSGQITKRCII